MNFSIATVRGIGELVSLLINCLRMRFSSSYHEKLVSEYWSKTNITHGDMHSISFDFYANELRELVGLSCSGIVICDYGGGNGELAIRMLQESCSIDVAEFSDNFKDSICAKGLKFVDAKSLPLARYDLIIANNCFFYVHPKKISSEIYRLQQSLKQDGVLWITDVPVRKKINLLTDNFLLRIFYRITGVYQIRLGGFFISSNRMINCFDAVEFPSWCRYRAHFRLYNKELHH